METLLLAVIIFAVQPAKAPPHKRATEANRTESTRHTENAQDNQTQPAQPTPAAPEPSVTPEGQRDAAATNEHAQQRAKQTSDEDRSTQRKLTWFTGVLAAVGGLQLFVMLLTWLVYRRQAREMRRQRHEMRQQRHVMLRQWKAMGKQAELMEGQLVEMKTAAAQAVKQIAIAEDNMKIILSKERARLRLEAVDLRLPDESTPLASAEYKVRLYGPTDAVIRATISDAIVSDSEEPPKVTPLSSLFIPAIISPSDSPFTNYQLVNPAEDTWKNIPEVVKGIYNRTKFVHFWGMILYDDVFGNHYYTHFRFVWYVVPGVTRGGKPHGRWTQCGPPEDNRAV